MKGKKVSFILEATFGEVNPNPKPLVMCVKSNDLVSTDETEDGNNCISSTTDGGGEFTVIGATQSGNVEAKAYFEQISVALAMVQGKPTTVDNGDGTFTHTFSSATACLPSYSIQNLWSNQEDICDGGALTEIVEIFTGVKANTWSMTANKSTPTWSLGLMGGGSYDSTVKTPALAKVDETNEVVLGSTELLPKQVTVSIDGSSYCLLNEFTVSCDNGLKLNETLGACADDITREKYEVKGTIKGIFDLDLERKIANGQKVELKLKYVNGTNSLEFIVAEAQFKFKSKPVKYGEKWATDAEFVGTRSASGSERLKMVLVNGVASYE